MNKTIDIQKAVDMIKDGDTIMIGGFLAVGAPLKLIDAMVKKGLKDLTLITNDSAFLDKGVGKMIVNKQKNYLLRSKKQKNT